MKSNISQRVSFLALALALPAAAVFCWLVMRVLYQRMPQYDEFVTGYTTWTAYFKSGDMTLAYLVIGGVLVLYAAFALFFKLLSQKVTALGKDLDQKKEYSSLSLERCQRLETILFLILFSQFSLAGILKCLQLSGADFFADAKRMGQILWVCQIGTLAACLGLGYFYFRGEKQNKMKWALELSQLFLPLCFLWIARYEYVKDGMVITQYDSVKMKLAAGAAAVILIVYNGYRIFFRNRNRLEAGIYLSSFLSLAVFASYTLPRGTISGSPLEMYHYGELSGPLHQLLKFGTVPYLDTMPIHGVCDYFQAGIWYVLFDGTYASFEAAMVIGCVAIALITAAVYYYFVDSRLAGLLCILLFSLFGDKYYYVRWAFALPFILIVFSGRIRKNFPKLLWCWTFISILSIAWNPSIGGACALATLPMVLYEGIHEKGWKVFLGLKEKEVQKEILPFYIPLLILGICFIPMFFAILRYIVENSAAILETTGDILMEELNSPFVWYATFGFVFPLAASCYFLAGRRGEEKKTAVYAFLFLVLFNGIIVRYTFVRTQFGERGIIVTCICSLFLILMIFLPYLKEHRSVSLTLITAFLFFSAAWFKGSNLLSLPGKVFLREEIPKEYVYAPAEETGIPGLGDIYITQEQKTELMNLNELANDLGKEYQFVDMTNQLAHYNILDKKVLLPFSSTYNTNNKVMQTRAVEVLKELQPEIVVVWPAWEHDSGALSTRNYYLYQYLADHYVPCRYKNIIFLTNNSRIREEFEPADAEFAEIMHKERLKKLPAAWGNEYLEENETRDLDLNYSLVDTNAEKLGDNRYQMTAEENYFLYAFEEPVKGSEIPFLRICVEDLSGSGEPLSFEGVLYFMDEGKGLKESRRFIYDGGEGEFLIPLTTSPYWSYSDSIRTVMADFISGSLEGKEVSVRLEFEGRREGDLT